MIKLEIHHNAVSKITDKASSMDIKIIKWKVVEDKAIPMVPKYPTDYMGTAKRKKYL